MSTPATPFAFSADPWWTWRTASIRQVKNESCFKPEAPRYGFFWARNAIYHCLTLLNLEPGARVLIPAYICRAAVDPFFAYGLEVDFYAIKSDCSADVSDIEARIRPDTKAVLAAHYFGFPQEIRQIRDLCDRYGIALIEDCAHVLAGEAGGQAMGTFGDAAIFSWRKFLPVYDGGELVLNRPGRMSRTDVRNENALFTLRVALNVIERSLREVRQPMLRAAYLGFRAFESAARSCVDALFARPAALRVETASTEFDKNCLHLPTSRVSRWIKSHSDIERIIERRRHNYQFLQRQLAPLNSTVLFPVLPDSICPWVLPVFFDGIPQAHRKLRQKGIPAAAWDDVRHPAVGPGRFKDTDYLFENLVFLPIHQCLNDADLAGIASAAKSL